MAKTSDMKRTKAELVEELQALRRQVARLQGRKEEGRDQAEGAPFREHDMLQTLLDNSPDYLFFKDRESRFVKTNDAHAQFLMGLDNSQEAVGKTDFDLFLREEAQRFYDEEQQIMETGQPVVAREWSLTSSTTGEPVWLSEHKLPVRDETGQVIGLVGISRNITELKRAEEALKEAHAEVEKQVEERTAELQREVVERKRAEEALARESDLLHLLMESVPDWIFFKDAESRIVRSNRAHAQLLGFDDPQQVVGKTDFDLFPGEDAQRFYDEEQKMLHSGQAVVARLGQTPGKDGEVFWVSETKIPLKDETSQVIGLVGISRDVTEIKRAEEALARESDLLHALMENVPDWIFFKDAESRIVRSNRAHAQLLGFDDPQQVVGKTDFDLFPHEDAQRFYDEEQKMLRSGQAVVARLGQTPGKDGEVFWVSETKIPMKDETGRVIGLVGISRNVTDIKLAELALEHRALQLQTATEVSRTVSSVLDPDELIQRVVNLVQERFNLYYAGLFLADQAGEWAVLRAGTGEAGQQMLEAGHKLKVGGESMIGQCVGNKSARIALDVGEEAVRFENPLLPETRSELALPLVSRGEALGALTIQSTEEAAFTEEAIIVLQTMADQMANAIANTRLYEEARQERALLQALMDNSPDYLFFKDRESRFIRTNKAHAQNLLGVSDPQEVEGKTDFDLYPGEEENTQRFYDEEQELMETGRPVLGREWKVPGQTTGEDVWLSEHKIPILGEAGEVVGLIGIGRDVTARKRAELALERRAVQLQTVAEVGREAAAILDVRQLLNLAASRVSEGFGFYHTGVFLLDELGQNAILRAASSEGGQRMLARGHSLPVGQVGVVGHAAAANEPHIALDVGEDAVFFDNPDLPETRSEMALPLSIRGEVIGVLDVQSEEPAAFAEEDVATLRILADQLAIAIQNARLVERTEEQLRELNLLYGQFSTETWERLLSAERPMGYVYDRIDVLPSDELPSPAFDLAVESNKVVELDASEESGPVLAVPLRVRGQVIGSLGVEAGDGQGWTPEEITLVEAVSQQVAQAIDGARLFAEAQKTALSMESLYQTSRAISSSLEEEEMIHAVLEAVYRTLNCEHVLLNTVDEEKGTIGLQHGIWEGEFDIYPEWREMGQYSLDGNHIVPDIYRSGRTEIIGEWDDRFNREIWDRFGYEYFLHIFMPINLRERVIGVIEVAFDKRRKDRISDDEVQMLSAFMDQAAVALENVRLFDQVQRRAQREHRIYEITNRLRRSPDISTILQTAVNELGQALQVDRAMVRLRVKPREGAAGAEGAAIAEGQEQPVEG